MGQGYVSSDKKILDSLAEGPLRFHSIFVTTGLAPTSIKRRLERLAKEGKVKMWGGLYKLACTTAEENHTQ